MMDDEFFSSPFGNRLTVSASRPIVAEAKVDATEVLPVPDEGRPADYRGAVGTYGILTQASPTAVSAGDPITLNIRITGTGPMELVQAPPLSELPLLTADFKVADQSLAGYVQDNTKLFSTTIRPRHEGVTQIPSIPFSFFDPVKGNYETVLSDPIAITVDKSESLSLDAIVGKQRHDGGSLKDTGLDRNQKEPDFTNDDSANVLVSQTPAAYSGWWWIFVIAPPLLWLSAVVIRNRSSIRNRLPRIRSAKTRCLTEIERAEDSSGIVTSMTKYIASRTRQTTSSSDTAIGALRTVGISQAANDVEAFFLRCEKSPVSGSSLQSVGELLPEARELLDQIESALNSINKSQVRPSGTKAAGRAAKMREISSSARRVSILIAAILVASSASVLTAADNSSAVQMGIATAPHRTNQPRDDAKLSVVQQQTLLTEAGDVYSRATAVAKTDSAEANDLFTSSAQKYQLLVDSGVQNAMLYRNLGNAYLQCNQLGRSIVNYERARQLNPSDRQLAVNLQFANSLVKDQKSAVDGAMNANKAESMSLTSILQKMRMLNGVLVEIAGVPLIIWTVVISSLLFWSLQIIRASGYRIPVWRLGIVPLFLLMTSLTSAVLASTQTANIEDGVVVANSVTLRAGDGELFDKVLSLETAQGHRVQIMTTRGNWTQVRTRHGQIGWVPASDVESIRSVRMIAHPALPNAALTQYHAFAHRSAAQWLAWTSDCPHPH